MPYIHQDVRDCLDPFINELQAELGDHEGDLNYAITRLVTAYFKKEPRYQTIARITGVLDNVKAEFYRRIAGPYEDRALDRNGDVPEFEAITSETPYLCKGDSHG